MFIKGQVTELGTIDVKCDVATCNKSCKVAGDNLAYASFKAFWPYGSRFDGERWECHFCEDCAHVIKQMLHEVGIEVWVESQLL